ncbi:MAG TPA: YtxH domain-containing protein [Terriglobales bacterium]|nr:YtxH domain-containing protein [Terriglobales bacterium]
MSNYERIGEYQPSERNSLGVALTFLLVGIGVGAVTALLLAPKSGKQLRRDLRRRYEDTREAMDEFTDQARDMFERGAEWARDAKERVAPLARGIRAR